MIKFELTYLRLISGEWTTNSDFIVQDAINYALEKLSVFSLADAEGVDFFAEEQKQWTDALHAYAKRTGKIPEHKKKTPAVWSYPNSNDDNNNPTTF
jgi:hypothetical protein